MRECYCIVTIRGINKQLYGTTSFRRTGKRSVKGISLQPEAWCHICKLSMYSKNYTIIWEVRYTTFFFFHVRPVNQPIITGVGTLPQVWSPLVEGLSEHLHDVLSVVNKN